jgi:rhodanese-related sulfurtransferase
MGNPTGESTCAKVTPGTVAPCELHGSALGTEQPAGTIPAQAGQGLSKSSRNTPAPGQSNDYSKISVSDLENNLKNKNFTLVNVHTPFAGNLPQTDLSIPYDQIDQNLNQLPADKSAKIILYCRSGRMSSMAAADLVKQGYSNVWSLDGGMAAWEQAGFTVQK